MWAHPPIWLPDNAGRVVRGIGRMAGLWCALLGFSGGCADWSWRWPGVTASPSSAPAEHPPPPVKAEKIAPSVSAESRPNPVGEGLRLPKEPIRLKISFHVLRIWAKQGVFSQSNLVWNYLDEEALPAEVSSHLRRNGLRVAKGQVAIWPAIKDLLDEQSTGTSAQEIIVAPPAPLEIEASMQPRDQVLFVVRPDRRLKGGDFVSSTNLLRVEYFMALDDWRSLELEVMPEIRLPLYRQARKLTAEGWVYHPIEQPGIVLRELAFRVQMSPGEFLLIGPSRQAEAGHYAGSLLLRDETEDGWTESIYVITLRVEQTEARGG